MLPFFSFDESGTQPRPFMPPMEVFRIQAIAAPSHLFIALLSAAAKIRESGTGE
jgi:hypothetical protein